MNNALVMFKNSILLHKNTVEIHHVAVIWKASQYDKVELYIMNYLHAEGFLEDDKGNLFHIDEIQIIDGTGKRVLREQLI